MAAHDVPAQREHAAEAKQLDAERNAEIEHAHDDSGRPELWGWHHEFRAGRQIGGWLSFLILGALLTTTHYNKAGTVAIIATMAVLTGGLLWDRHHRKNQWRS
ncbi:MAG: DUF2631 domain-containing protein [Jatrophihabitantaceae bacterium]